MLPETKELIEKTENLSCKELKEICISLIMGLDKIARINTWSPPYRYAERKLQLELKNVLKNINNRWDINEN